MCTAWPEGSSARTRPPGRGSGSSPRRATAEGWPSSPEPSSPEPSSPEPSSAGAFLAAVFLAGAFLAGAFLAGAFLAGAFLAAVCLAGAFRAGGVAASAARRWLRGAERLGSVRARAVFHVGRTLVATDGVIGRPASTESLNPLRGMIRAAFLAGTSTASPVWGLRARRGRRSTRRNRAKPVMLTVSPEATTSVTVATSSLMTASTSRLSRSSRSPMAAASSFLFTSSPCSLCRSPPDEGTTC